MRVSFVLVWSVLLLLLALVTGCTPDPSDATADGGSATSTDGGKNPCAGVSCGGHGTCAPSGGSAVCTCNTGYYASGLSCLAVSDTDTDTDAGANGGAGTDEDAGAGAGAKTDAGTGTRDAGSAADASLPHFSFFLTSLKAMRALSMNEQGFGGDLRYGETGAGAGLRGADKICAAIAERSMAGASSKQWRAFLSATSDENGKKVDAIDRVGPGPWYDRLGRLLANNTSELANKRPMNAHAAIKNDLPNEDGVPNHNPDQTGIVDNHETLTGSNAQGRLYSATSTCKDWTTSDGSSANGFPRVGHSWPRSASDPLGNWFSAFDAAGCAANVTLIELGGAPIGSTGVGAAGGYGGFYCFALVP